MDFRKARENLGRIKLYYLKGESLRSLGTAVVAVKELAQAGTLPMDIRGLLRESIQCLGRDDRIKPYLKAPLVYQPGQERALFVALVTAYKQLEAAAGREDHDAALERKRRLDQALNEGQKLLAQGKTSEAEESFQTALRFYKDEHRVYQLVGKWLLDAAAPRRAAPYLKKAMELEPDNAVARELYDATLLAREDSAR